MHVKLCSIKNEVDIDILIKSRANAAGFLVGQTHESDDFITASQAGALIKKLPPFITPVLVTHLNDHDDVIQLLSETNATAVQLHGSPGLETLINIKKSKPYIKIIFSIHINADSSVSQYQEYYRYADAFLLDSLNPVTNQIGGTGLTHDWNISSLFIRDSKLPIILAGGLTPYNVKGAINITHPFGVDVNSGVKDSNGFRDKEKCIEFVRNANSC